MAKKETEVSQNKPVEVRAQTEDEIRRRLKSQGKIAETPKKKDEGVHEVTEDEALVRIEEREERKAKDARKEDPLVRQQTKKDIALRQVAVKEREGEKKDESGSSRVLTQKDIDARNETEPEPEPEPKPEPDAEVTEPPEEIFAKDVVSFKDDDGNLVTGKVLRVMPSKDEAVIDTEEAKYTVPLKDLTKEKKEDE